MGIQIKKFITGLQSNCYVVSEENSKDAFMVDTGFFEQEFDDILDYVQDYKLILTKIINTHGHPDHTNGNKILKKTTGAEILIHKDDEIFLKASNWPTTLAERHHIAVCPMCGIASKPLFEVKEGSTEVTMSCRRCGPIVVFDASTVPDHYLEEGDSLNLAKYNFKIIHTPGHSPGGICIYNSEEKIIFTGDTLFNNGWGRVDSIFSDPEDMERSLKRLWELPEDTKVFSGHGPETTIGAEKARSSQAIHLPKH